MSTQNIVNERSRRTSIAALLLEREDFDPTYEDDNAVDPQNLPDNILAIYNTLVDSNLQMVDPNAGGLVQVGRRRAVPGLVCSPGSTQKIR